MSNAESQKQLNVLYGCLAAIGIIVIVAMIVALNLTPRKVIPNELEMAKALCDANSKLKSYDPQEYLLICEDGSKRSIEGLINLAENNPNEGAKLLAQYLEMEISLTRLLHKARTMVGCDPKDADCVDKLKEKDAAIHNAIEGESI